MKNLKGAIVGILAVLFFAAAGGLVAQNDTTTGRAWGPALVFGTDNSVAGTLQLANSAANAHTIFKSGATTTNTIAGFATVPTTGHIVTCTVATTTCTLTDGGAVPTGTVTSIATTSPITGGTITSTGTIACATCTVTIASGTKALATGAISSGSCTSAQTATATGTQTTDTLMADFNADPTGVTGYAPVTTGMLTIIKYPTADTANFKVCNLTASSITPGSITLNFRVVR